MAGIREQLDNLDEREFDRTEAMVHSMTPQERAHPKLINGSRRARIARGSGRTVADVNDLLERLHRGAEDDEAAAPRRGHAGDAGHAGACPAWVRGKKAKGKAAARKKAKGGRSGNPAKRAEQERRRPSAASRAWTRPSGRPSRELPAPRRRARGPRCRGRPTVQR